MVKASNKAKTGNNAKLKLLCSMLELIAKATGIKLEYYHSIKTSNANDNSLWIVKKKPFIVFTVLDV